MKKRLTLSAAAFAAALALGGCSSGSGNDAPDANGMPGMNHGSPGASSSSNPETSAQFNEADTMFVQMMIPHHAQAVAMSEIVLGKEGVPDAVRHLAAEIKDAQGPEIELMTGWLRSWGQPTESPGHAGHGMSGMMSGEQMAALEAANGPDAGELFLTQMIAHHEGAVTMARTESADGLSPEAVRLSKEIISSQEAEIKEMKELLDGEASPDAAAVPRSHIHGLSVDGQSGKVLLATHDGLFSVTSSGSTLIGEPHDLMGFTAAADGVVYASGHPGPSSRLPNPLGLLRSGDGGKTWEQLSRQGKSDFHALTAVQSGIVAYDGTMRTSPDGKNWSPAAADFAPAVLAGSPLGDTVLATTPGGLQRSTDGGKSWALNSSAPVIQYAAFAGRNVVFGVEPDGTVHSSFDAGNTWSRTGTIGEQVQAMAAVEGGNGKAEVWAATSTGIVMSADGGATFSPWTGAS